MQPYVGNPAYPAIVTSYGLTVIFVPGASFQIKLSPELAVLLEGHLCGLCGKYNYDSSDDLPYTGAMDPNFGVFRLVNDSYFDENLVQPISPEFQE